MVRGNLWIISKKYIWSGIYIYIKWTQERSELGICFFPSCPRGCGQHFFTVVGEARNRRALEMRYNWGGEKREKWGFTLFFSRLSCLAFFRRPLQRERWWPHVRQERKISSNSPYGHSKKLHFCKEVNARLVWTTYTPTSWHKLPVGDLAKIGF